MFNELVTFLGSHLLECCSVAVDPPSDCVCLCVLVHAFVYVRPCTCECERERERESLCVCVCLWKDGYVPIRKFESHRTNNRMVYFKNVWLIKVECPESLYSTKHPDGKTLIWLVLISHLFPEKSRQMVRPFLYKSCPTYTVLNEVGLVQQWIFTKF